MEIKIRFVKERTTKNTVVFHEVTSTTPVVGTLYMQKATFPGGRYPDEVWVTIEGYTGD